RAAPIAHLIDRSNRGKRRPSSADAAVPPHGRRSSGEEESHSHRGQSDVGGDEARRRTTSSNRDGGETENNQRYRDELPRARCAQPRQQSEATRERTKNRTDRVRRVRAADLRAQSGASTAEQGDEQGELITGHYRGREDDDGRNERPARNL